MNKLLADWSTLSIQAKAVIYTCLTVSGLVLLSTLGAYWPDLLWDLVNWVFKMALGFGFLALIYWGWLMILKAAVAKREKANRKAEERQRR